MSLRLCRLLLSRLRLSRPAATALAATAAARHALAAVHPAVAVPVRTAATAHVVALRLAVLATLLLTRRRLVPGMARVPGLGGCALRLVLRMVLVRLCRRRRLGGGRHGERKRDRTGKNLHLNVS
ncbi:MAG TPA: hypothetical protein VF702_03525 [Allosphingosinicella sp.]